jgi:hypothetical protein
LPYRIIGCRQLFSFQSPIGQTLEIGGIEFRVIGVLEKKEQLFGGGRRQ